MERAIVLAGALCLLASSAMAADSGWYVSANIGSSKIKDISHKDLDDAVILSFSSSGLQVVSAASSLDKEDTAWSLVAGYKFSQNFALEAGYTDLGGAQYNASGTARPFGSSTNFPVRYAADVSTKGPQLAAIGIVPLGVRFDLHAKLGVIFADTTVEQSAVIQAASASDRFSENSTDTFFGLGASFRFNERVALNLDWQIYKDVGDEEEIGESDIDLLTAGVTLSF